MRHLVPRGGGQFSPLGGGGWDLVWPRASRGLGLLDFPGGLGIWFRKDLGVDCVSYFIEVLVLMRLFEELDYGCIISAFLIFVYEFHLLDS